MSVQLFLILVISWIIFGIVIFPVLLKVTVPYGRHTTSTWGPMISNKVGWIIMEIPALLVFATFIIISGAQGNTIIWIISSFWVAHYINRVLIYPFRTKTRGKKMPLVIMLFAIFFNLVNASINGYWFGYLSSGYEISWLSDPRFIMGVVLFVTGFGINQWADKKLLLLRSGGKTGYYVPYGGLFKYISCPNFFGEMIEWLGFAVMTWCLPTLSFFVWTAFNLVPRARDHHHWYKSNFEEYPEERKAVIPFIL